VCDLETSRICAPHICDISSLRVKMQTHTHKYTQFYIRRPIFLNNALNKAESSRKGWYGRLISMRDALLLMKQVREVSRVGYRRERARQPTSHRPCSHKHHHPIPPSPYYVARRHKSERNSEK